MKAIELHLPKDLDKSFVVFRERGKFFPAPWHYHPEYELVLVNKSTGRRMVGDHIGHFDEGDLVLMGPMLPHVWVNDPAYVHGQANHLADALVIHFGESFLGESFLDLPELEKLKAWLRLSKQGIEIKGDSRKKIAVFIRKMPYMNGLQRLASLFNIFDILSNTTEYELLASPKFIENTSLKNSNRISTITEYIMRNFDQEITLPEIAATANMGLTTFCNFFKENYRISFVEYLIQVRVGHACKLLFGTDKNIVEIAYESGFNTLANFNRQFKRIKGMTPKEYRITVNI